MDERPFRMSRPSDRNVANRVAAPAPAATAPIRSQPEEPQLVQQQPVQASGARRGTQSPKPRRRILLPIALALAGLIVLGGIGWFAWSATQNSGTAIDSSKYQAVFFTNGQVYFGKLHAFNGEYMKLTDIYYLQTQQSSSSSSNPQQTSTEQNNNVQLIKLGDEIHGPQDEMMISKSQMLFYENLKSDGKVAQSIGKYKSSH